MTLSLGDVNKHLPTPDREPVTGRRVRIAPQPNLASEFYSVVIYRNMGEG